MTVWLVLSGGCALRGSEVSGDLLSGRAPVRSPGVTRAGVLTDGLAVPDGETWNSDRTAIFDGPAAHAVYDLGESRKLRALWLQGDANDAYDVSVSDDGVTFRPLWSAPPSGGVGMQVRIARDLDAAGRYLKLAAVSGDGSFSVSELAAFEETPATFPSVTRKVGLASDERVRTQFVLLALALVLLVVLGVEGRSRWALALLVLPLLAAWKLFEALPGAAVNQREVSLARGLVGAVALAVVLWDRFAPARFTPDRRLVHGTLALCGVVGMLAFYNLGRPQFRNEGESRATFVHYFDLRQYYATAKYFKEISYWQMYEADVAAWAEDKNIPLDQVASIHLRDLHSNHGTTVGDRREAIAAVKQQFSPARWEQFKSDARYYRAAMGEGTWLQMLNDLGGNATPVWIAVAWFLFNTFDLSNNSLAAMALLDPLLLLAMFVMIGFAFGPRTMWICLAIFGANDFIMFGTNWAGAVLRHDWLAFLGLGACALRLQRWKLAGVFLGLATSIRAFPALAVFGLVIPAVWAVGEQWLQTRRMPRPREILRDHWPTFLAGACAVATVAVLVLVTSAVLGSSAWPEWLKKVALLDAEAHSNPVSLKTLLVGSDESRPRLVVARWPLFAAALVSFCALVALAARKKKLEQAAMLGLILLPVLLYPSNYYLHVVCLLPLIAVERKSRPSLDAADAWGWAALLAVCAAQYFTTLLTDFRLHFYQASALLMAGTGVLLLAIIRRDGAEVLELLPPWFGAKRPPSV